MTAVNRKLFIGDSHTCGFDSIPEKTGPGSYTYWNDNNYSEIYGDINNCPIVTYAQAGVGNRVYTDWITSVFNQYNDIDNVYLCLAPLNRFTLAFADQIDDEALPVDNFMCLVEGSTENKQRYSDLTNANSNVQLFQKPVYDDYNNFPGIEINPLDGLRHPDLRKDSYMQVKLFFEMNTFLEKRDFLQQIYTWDNICADNNANLRLFYMVDRGIYPRYNDFYGKLKVTKIAEKTVETFFREKHIDHTKFLLSDQEHYNKDYHTLIAERYIPYLDNL